MAYYNPHIIWIESKQPVFFSLLNSTPLHKKTFWKASLKKTIWKKTVYHQKVQSTNQNNGFVWRFLQKDE